MAIAKIALILTAATPTGSISLLVISDSGNWAANSKSLPSILRYAQRFPPVWTIPDGLALAC